MTHHAITELTLDHLSVQRVENSDAINRDIETLALALRDDEETRVVIFTGEGKHFSSGADLHDAGKEYQGSLALRRRKTRIGERAILAVLGIDQIAIAAWNGAAMGGGACLATAMDFRVGAPWQRHHAHGQ